MPLLPSSSVMSGSGSGSGPLQPTWHGFIQNSMDGLVLFEACLSGKLHHVPRRPHDRERASLIKSGSVFIYEENASGIKRWTDGVAWSPSRILGNFLIYRELEKPFPPGEKKRAMKRKRSSQEPEGRRDSEENEVAEYNRLPPTPPSPANPPESKSSAPGTTDSDKEVERQLIGSLVDSYGFRPNGLVKKTMSISLNGVSHHLVSYYTVEDVKQRKLQRPLTDTRLNGIAIRPELYLKQNFRAPVEESDQYAVDGNTGHAYPHMGNSYMVPASGYMMRQSYVPPPGYPMYGAAPVSTGPGVYASLPATAQPAPSWSQPYSAAPPQQSYSNYYSTRNETSTPQAPSNSYAPMPPMQSSQYQSPMRTPAQSYGQPPSMTTSSTPVATQSQYQPAQTATTSQYQPTSYSVQTSSHQSASPQQQSMRSPPVGPPQSMSSYSGGRSNLPSMPNYRQYASQGPGSHEMPSIGMASGYGSSHAQPSSGSYGAPSYANPGLSAPQSYRHSSDATPGAQNSQYYNDGKPAVSSYT
ncbi:hypothetical protein D6D01_02406 [Aureobasidium pullulans]|uniref:Gluconate transport-inducing protein n=1 Tax=Aureobasidium pullulans TaxID=5580 RepID=A0A4S9LT47_AURPU|nr:hypothetical protein D6D01_02406 [Aureobasidium pullulans]